MNINNWRRKQWKRKKNRNFSLQMPEMAGYKMQKGGMSLVIQWLRFHVPSSEGTGSIPGWETNILVAENFFKVVKFNYILPQSKGTRGYSWGKVLEMAIPGTWVSPKNSSFTGTQSSCESAGISGYLWAKSWRCKGWGGSIYKQVDVICKLMNGRVLLSTEINSGLRW